MELPSFCIDAKNAQILALLVALFGILILYYWPASSRYEEVSIARAAIMGEKELVLIEGKIAGITNKSSGRSVKVCEGESCITAYVKNNTAADFVDEMNLNSDVKIWGEISAIYSNRFITAHKIENA
jgi:hypothetical protein